MDVIEFAVVEPGAMPFKAGNVNDTYRGLVRSNSGLESAVIKDLDPKQLANELVVATIANDYGLPIPRCYLAAVPTGALAVSKGPKLATGERLVFASIDVGVPNLTQRISGNAQLQMDVYDELKRWPELGRLYALDTWIANVDRHRGNLLTGGAGSFWLIDHGHSLTGPSWSPADLKPDGDYRNRLKDWLTPEMTVAQRVSRAKQCNAASTEFASVVPSSIISRSKVGQVLPANDTDAIEDFLAKRTACVSQFAHDALDCAGLV